MSSHLRQLPAEVSVSIEESPESVVADFSKMMLSSLTGILFIAREDFGIETIDPLSFICDVLPSYVGPKRVKRVVVTGNTLVIETNDDVDELALSGCVQEFLHHRFGLRVEEKPTGPQPRELQPTARSSAFPNHHGGLRP